MNKNFHLIINPGRYPWFAKELKKLMRYVHGGTIVESKSPEHFEELIRQFIASDNSYLLIWGGDGTANLALNCLMKETDPERRKQIAVGFLRGGSGNGIQDSYEVPKGLSAQVKTYLISMAEELTQKVDLLKISYDDKERYGQLFGTGLDAKILQARNMNKRIQGDRAPHPGFIPYVIPAVKIIWNETRLLEEPQFLEMKEGRFAFRGTRSNAEFPFNNYHIKTWAPLIELGVRPYFGWYYKICPDVVCNDGRFDVYLFNITSPLSIPFQLFNLWNGLYQRINQWNAKRGLPLIEHYKIKEMTLKGMPGRMFHIDGELKETEGDIRIEVEPEALNFLVPRSFHEKFHPIHMLNQD
ncbi:MULTISPECIES: diacylglycerol kinase family protein [unclassified Oceanispirochaeta]|uniref:diacylglycerol/lipid kinase family protein n=1 Tax=unclassified Oceanispirochaeta TaxID=2635722 RepID=UPI000E09A0A5|nr:MULTISPECIES: diacylglycerol kinase family protein [unclassified Oceanispirochaeta]MBF9017502.1 sphingosine kinase [Oceanispirochaeta sp. M2]NPD74074.1 sphingosine kinase [Oceanispirochaeta sp. M1]RDG30116.1 sphingosine kinase [Oceanispirochaeta sp. M1]